VRNLPSNLPTTNLSKIKVIVYQQNSLTKYIVGYVTHKSIYWEYKFELGDKFITNKDFRR